MVKLVESNRADRPVPIISFIARQRDLRDLIGQHIAGAERLAFADVLDHHEGRFGVINLEDRNLPAIAEKRILLPEIRGGPAADGCRVRPHLDAARGGDENPADPEVQPG